jgi:hypothetical protein
MRKLFLAITAVTLLSAMSLKTTCHAATGKAR